jgi:hypothetical protein
MAAPYALAVLSASTSSTRPKGYLRKLLLRATNRSIVSRFAARASTAIPCYGIYAGMHAVRRDVFRSAEAAQKADVTSAAAYGFSAASLMLDLAAQATVLAGLAAGAPASAAVLLSAADKTSLVAAATACLVGVYADCCGCTNTSTHE